MRCAGVDWVSVQAGEPAEEHPGALLDIAVTGSWLLGCGWRGRGSECSGGAGAGI